ncbi:hypothetical protein ABK040_001364 [Willaertia magna]
MKRSIHIEVNEQVLLFTMITNEKENQLILEAKNEINNQIWSFTIDISQVSDVLSMLFFEKMEELNTIDYNPLSELKSIKFDQLFNLEIIIYLKRPFNKLFSIVLKKVEAYENRLNYLEKEMKLLKLENEQLKERLTFLEYLLQKK